jgi:hypothetical protein
VYTIFVFSGNRLPRLHFSFGLRAIDATIPGMRKLLILTILFALPLLAHAADVTGSWKVKLDFEGHGGDATLILTQKGTEITGQYSGVHGDAEVNGTIDGKNVELDFETPTMLIRYHGKISPDGTRIEGRYDHGGVYAGTFVATKGTDAKTPAQ